MHTDFLSYLETSRLRLLKSPYGVLKFSYLVPGGPYPQLFDWDAYFIGLSSSDAKTLEALEGAVKNFLFFRNADGLNRNYIPREISPRGIWAFPKVDTEKEDGFFLRLGLLGKKFPSLLSHYDAVGYWLSRITPKKNRRWPEQCKPFLAQMALRVAQKNDFSWLNTHYEGLIASIAFWEKNRLTCGPFFVWKNGLESGADNTPLVCNSPEEVSAGVDLQCYFYKEYLALAKISFELKKTDKAKEYQQKANLLAKNIREQMWFPHEKSFLNLDVRDKRPIKQIAWSCFLPLWAGVASKDQAKEMIETHLLAEDQFWSPWGIRTISKKDTLYNPENGYWRGPVWVLPNFLCMLGLLKYGYQQKAIELAERTLELVKRDYAKSGGMNECYHPESGAPVGHKNFLSWNLLATQMPEIATSGIDPTSFDHHLPIGVGEDLQIF